MPLSLTSMFLGFGHNLLEEFSMNFYFDPEKCLTNDPFQIALHLSINKFEIRVYFLVDNITNWPEFRLFSIAVQTISNEYHQEYTNHQTRTN